METSKGKTICILGRQPALGLAELESLYGAGNVRPVGGVAAQLTIEPTDIDFERLGGSVKLARVLARLPHDWPHLEKHLLEQIPRQLKHAPSGKFTLGLSVYGMDISTQTIQRSLLKIKKELRETGRPVRIVPNPAAALSSAQVLHNKLTGPSGWELLLVRDGEETILAQTLFIQDIEGYGRRDQARPKRDATVGMLPPKLAQIIINLINPAAGATILDPFCGTGVILQEALLMEFNVVGTDLEPRMVDYATENIDWLRALRSPLPAASQIELGDATSFTWPSGIRYVASETYLGRPLTRLPERSKLEAIISDVNLILTKSLKNLSAQLPSGSKLCLALPAWRSGQSFIDLSLLAKITDMGYNRLEFAHAQFDQLVYWREGQVVGRRLLVLQKI